ncbi:MAG: DUF3267 domain-containing protein [Dehalococcoidia bacterium]|nr:DUF3267 domain-containing protein [Dehalococcoidia bacterium]
MLRGQLITVLTLPGVVVHELAHVLFCLLTATRVTRVRLFRFGNPAGYVIHDRPSSAWKTILIGIGPFFVNTGLGFVIALSALVLRGNGRMESTALFAVLIWLGVSIAMHSFPSKGDAKGIWGTVFDRSHPLLARIAAVPIVGLIYLGALGSVVWLDLVYAVAVTIGLPVALGIRVW